MEDYRGLLKLFIQEDPVVVQRLLGKAKETALLMQRDEEKSLQDIIKDTRMNGVSHTIGCIQYWNDVYAAIEKAEGMVSDELVGPE